MLRLGPQHLVPFFNRLLCYYYASPLRRVQDWRRYCPSAALPTSGKQHPAPRMAEYTHRGHTGHPGRRQAVEPPGPFTTTGICCWRWWFLGTAVLACGDRTWCLVLSRARSAVCCVLIVGCWLLVVGVACCVLLFRTNDYKLRI
jgi:hypothetical protein